MGKMLSAKSEGLNLMPGLELAIVFQSLLPQCCGYRCVLPCLVSSHFPETGFLSASLCFTVLGSEECARGAHW